MKKKSNVKTYVGIVIAAILVLLLANPKWLPLPESLKNALSDTEKANMFLKGDTHTTIAQLITLVLALAIVWLAYQVLKLILTAIGKKGGRLQSVTSLICGLLKYIAVIAAIVWGPCTYNRRK